MITTTSSSEQPLANLRELTAKAIVGKASRLSGYVTTETLSPSWFINDI